MAVSVVTALEVIDVDHRDRIGRFQSKQSFVKGPARRQRRQFIVVSEKVGGLDDRTRQDKSSSRKIGDGNSPYSAKVQGQEGSGQSPEKPALRRFVEQHISRQQYYCCGSKRKYRCKRQLE